MARSKVNEGLCHYTCSDGPGSRCVVSASSQPPGLFIKGRDVSNPISLRNLCHSRNAAADNGVIAQRTFRRSRYKSRDWRSKHHPSSLLGQGYLKQQKPDRTTIPRPRSKIPFTGATIARLTGAPPEPSTTASSLHPPTNIKARVIQAPPRHDPHPHIRRSSVLVLVPSCGRDQGWQDY
jgi:hypothetical protein